MSWGLISAPELEFMKALLTSLGRGSRGLELGTFLGHTSRAWALHRPDCEFTTIDHYQAYPHPHEQYLTYRATGVFQQRTLSVVKSLHQDLANLTCLEGTAPRDCPPGPWDLIFEDSDHTAQGLAETIPWCRANLAPRGYLCIHDHRPHSDEEQLYPRRWPAVEQWVETLSREMTLVRIVDSLVVFQR